MRRLFLVSALVCGMITGAMAQVDTAMSTAPIRQPYHLHVGAHVFAVGGGMNTTAATGRKVNPDIGILPSFGATIFAPFGGAKSRIGLRLDVGVNSINSQTRPYEYYDGKADFEGYYKENYSYFTVAPSINLAGAYIGLGINMPMKATMYKPDSGLDDYVVDKDNLKTALDLRIGGMINAMQTPFGSLYVDFQVNYFFAGLYKDGRYSTGSAVDQAGEPGMDAAKTEIKNFTPIGVKLGVMYLVNLSI